MSKLMGDIRAEPKPGTALRIMVEEHQHLDEFMAMVKAKMNLDEKHLTALKALRDSWNPEWNESGIWPLISPFLTHITDEIDEREKSATELNLRFAALPDTPPPNAPHEDCSDPLETLENVQISELERWRNQSNTVGVPMAHSADLETLLLPKHEREYRRAVVAQQTAAECAVKWHADTLPDVLERHQQRAEDVMSFLNVLFNFYSAIHAGLSISCSTALSSNRAFSSSEFISPRHDETEKEASHALLRAVDYRNYMLDGLVAQPMFGLGVKKTVSLLNELLTHEQVLGTYSSYHWKEDLLATAFELERAATRSELSALLKSLSKENQQLIPTCAFLMEEPLLPLPGDLITQYRTGISRTKLSSAMDAYLPRARQEVLTLMVRLADTLVAQFAKDFVWKVMASYLSHNSAAAGIIESIWRKWDIKNDCPLPDGVERAHQSGGKSEVIWKKNGSLYYGPMSNLSV